MGTYTSNYNLFMPTVGETGWGTLVNTNFSTIDSTMKGLSNRITTVENEVNGNLSCTSVTTSGKITGNGGIVGTTGTFSGAVTGTSFNGLKLSTTPFVVNVSPSANWFKLSSLSSSSTYCEEFMLNVLPLNPLLLYAGSVVFGKGTSSGFLFITAINADNTFSDLTPTSITDEMTITFGNIKALYIVAGKRYNNASNLFKIPLFSF